MEFERSVSLGYVRRILAYARWEPALSTASRNFAYCVKNGRYDLIGDFTAELNSLDITRRGVRPASIPLVLEGLLDKKLSAQIKVTKEYADRFAYFERTTEMLHTIKDRHCTYNEWKNKKLSLWQIRVHEMVMQQNDREVLWVCDVVGNCGKIFLAHFFSILYNFQLLDGAISVRDLGYLLKDEYKGYCFDICREMLNDFNYTVLESLKNGYLVTGKYGGKVKRFKPVPVVVFANGYPNRAMLSEDRWRVVTIGEGDFSEVDTEPVLSPNDTYPFVEPPTLPELSENFDLRKFLLDHRRGTTNNNQNPRSNEISQAPTCLVRPVGSKYTLALFFHKHFSYSYIYI